MNLAEVQSHDTATVTAIEISDRRYMQRLSELGFIKGTQVVPLFGSLTGGIRAYWLKGSVIAVRDKDAQRIQVRVI